MEPIIIVNVTTDNDLMIRMIDRKQCKRSTGRTTKNLAVSLFSYDMQETLVPTWSEFIVS